MPVALLLGFILVPLAELYVIVRVGRELGLPLTLGVLLLVSVLGAALVKREGLRTWLALRAAITSGQVPARELADAALVLVGGALLLTPGFLTDVVGLLLVFPPTRATVRRLLTAFAVRRALRPSGRGSRPPHRSSPRGGYAGSEPAAGFSREAAAGQVIEGEVLDRRLPDPEVRDAGTTQPRSQ